MHSTARNIDRGPAQEAEDASSKEPSTIATGAEVWRNLGPAIQLQLGRLEPFLVKTAPDLSKDFVAKERKLIEDIRGELRQGRRCQVYATFTGEHDVAARLEKGINSRADRSSRWLRASSCDLSNRFSLTLIGRVSHPCRVFGLWARVGHRAAPDQRTYRKLKHLTIFLLRQALEAPLLLRCISLMD